MISRDGKMEIQEMIENLMASQMRLSDEIKEQLLNPDWDLADYFDQRDREKERCDTVNNNLCQNLKELFFESFKYIFILEQFLASTRPARFPINHLNFVLKFFSNGCRKMRFINKSRDEKVCPNFDLDCHLHVLD